DDLVTGVQTCALPISSVDGRTWYAAHAASIGFAAAGFLVAARGGRPALAGALVGIAALGRLPVAAATPGLALLLARRAGLSYRRDRKSVAEGPGGGAR